MHGKPEEPLPWGLRVGPKNYNNTAVPSWRNILVSVPGGEFGTTGLCFSNLQFLTQEEVSVGPRQANSC